MDIRHLGASGLLVGGLAIDPPEPIDAPALLTWTETERVAGVRSRSGPLAADAAVLRWLGLRGTAIGEEPVEFEGWTLRATPYRPIPYATPIEALRKTLCALRSPRFAAGRLVRTLGRPTAPPLAVELGRGGERIAYLAQALHRFVTAAELERLTRFFDGCDTLVAGTDYDDEAATGRLAGAFGARTVVIADLTGPVRRRIGLPTRPIETVLATAPEGTRVLRAAE